MSSDDHKSPPVRHDDLNQKSKSDREVLEALIRSELADAKGNLRELNRGDLQKIAEDHFRPKLEFWIKTSAVIFAITVIGIVVAYVEIPKIIERKTKTYIEEKLVGTALTNTVEIVISNKATIFIDTHLNPLRTNVNSIEGTIKTLSLDVSNKQALLADQQVLIKNQQHIQELLVEANSGNLAAYQELQSISAQTNNLAVIATASLTELNLLFDIYRFRSYGVREFADPVSLKVVQEPIDEVIILDLNSPNWSQRETAVARIAAAKKDNTVPHLCERLFIETNLFVVADITKALNDITGHLFDPLDIDSVKKWWDANKLSLKYQSPYRKLRQFYQNDAEAVYVGILLATNSIPLLKEVVEADPTAWWSRCLLGSCYIITGDFTNADKEFSETEKNYPNYGLLHFDKSLFFLCQNNTDKAVESLNKALELRASYEELARRTFNDRFLTNSKIHWPSNSTNAIPFETP
jgi:tetratricopeptide (TPR) repeat protein